MRLRGAVERKRNTENQEVEERRNTVPGGNRGPKYEGCESEIRERHEGETTGGCNAMVGNVRVECMR